MSEHRRFSSREIYIVTAAIFPILATRAWVLSMLWGWYVVPVFGVQPLRMVFAFGIAVIVMEIIPSIREDNGRPAGELVVRALTSPLVGLALGWLGTFFI